MIEPSYLIPRDIPLDRTLNPVAFATIVAVVAGLVLAAASAIAHDLYVGVYHGGDTVPPQQQVRAARIATVLVGALAITIGIAAKGQNVAHLVALAFAVAASANFPCVLLTLYWKRCNTGGIVAGMIVGTLTAIGLVLVSPNMTYPNGAYVSVVDVDRETGGVRVRRFVAIDDCGIVINPMIVEGQIHGGLTEGFAMAFIQEIQYDAEGNYIGPAIEHSEEAEAAWAEYFEDPAAEAAAAVAAPEEPESPSDGESADES